MQLFKPKRHKITTINSHTQDKATVLRPILTRLYVLQALAGMVSPSWTETQILKNVKKVQKVISFFSNGKD